MLVAIGFVALERRHDRAAHVDGLGAARMERAAGGRIDRAGHAIYAIAPTR